jgi:hypothetical protein
MSAIYSIGTQAQDEIQVYVPPPWSFSLNPECSLTTSSSSRCPDMLGGARLEVRPARLGVPATLPCCLGLVVRFSSFGLPAVVLLTKFLISWSVWTSNRVFSTSSADACVLAAWSTSCVTS